MIGVLRLLAISVLLAAPAFGAELEVPEGGYAISDDLSLLPAPVREKRDALIAAAVSGDVEKLRAIFDAELAPPMVSFGDPEDKHPVDYLIKASADGKGLELLAVLANILEAPYGAIDGGDGDLIYTWPYFAAMDDISELTPAQIVDGYRLLGHDGFENERELGNWLYWRLSMTQRGEVQSFIAGD